jgi:DNA-binding winged helix-turn-helix (wHTH) protein
MNAGKSQGRKRLYEFGAFRLDPSERILACHGKRVSLPPRAFDTLVVLVQRHGHVLTKDELIGTLWPDTFVEENNLTQQISALRRALGSRRSPPDSGHGPSRTGRGGAPSGDSPEHEHIETVPKLGYRFISEVREVEEDAAGSPGTDEVESVVSERARARIVPGERREQEDPSGESVPAAAPPATPTAASSLVSASGWKKKSVPLAAAASAIVLLAVGLYRSGRPSRMPASSAGTPTLAVLPLRNLRPGAETDFLSLALTDAIINRLGYASALITEPLSAVAGYRNTELDARRLARELNVPGSTRASGGTTSS